MGDGAYRVALSPAALRDLRGLAIAGRRVVARSIDRLALDPRPRGAKVLEGRAGERIWRVRAGDYRILYEIRDRELIVLIVRVGHRREVYRR